MVSKTATLFKNLFITKKSLSAEIYVCKWNIDPRSYSTSSQDITAEYLLHQSGVKKIITSSSVHGSENGNIAFDGNPLNFAFFL